MVLYTKKRGGDVELFWSTAKHPYPLGAIWQVAFCPDDENHSRVIATFSAHSKVYSSQLVKDSVEMICAHIEETLSEVEWPEYSMDRNDHSFALLEPEEWSRQDRDRYASAIRDLARSYSWSTSELLFAP